MTLFLVSLQCMCSRGREALKCIAAFFCLAIRDLERYVDSIYRLHVAVANTAALCIDLNSDFPQMSRNKIIIKEVSSKEYDMEVLLYSIIKFFLQC